LVELLLIWMEDGQFVTITYFGKKGDLNVKWLLKLRKNSAYSYITSTPLPK
jgi:hypothetical protein